MAKSKDQKKAAVSEYKDWIKASKAIYLVSPSSITPNEATKLKKELFTLDSQFNVIKNSLFKLALEEEGISLDESLFEGPNAAIFASDKMSEAAKVITKFIKDTEKATVKGGILDGKSIAKEQVEALASLPTREVLLAQVVGTMNAPVSGFVNVLAGTMRSFLYVLNALQAQKA